MRKPLHWICLCSLLPSHLWNSGLTTKKSPGASYQNQWSVKLLTWLHHVYLPGQSASGTNVGRWLHALARQFLSVPLPGSDRDLPDFPLKLPNPPERALFCKWPWNCLISEGVTWHLIENFPEYLIRPVLAFLGPRKVPVNTEWVSKYFNCVSQHVPFSQSCCHTNHVIKSSFALYLDIARIIAIPTSPTNSSITVRLSPATPGWKFGTGVKMAPPTGVSQCGSWLESLSQSPQIFPCLMHFLSKKKKAN